MIYSEIPRDHFVYKYEGCAAPEVYETLPRTRLVLFPFGEFIITPLPL